MSNDTVSLGRDFARALSPLAFAADCGIENPDPWQIDALTTNSKRLLLCCSRQAGKSTVSALRALHTLLYEPGSTVILISPTLNQSQELYSRLRGFYENLSGAPRTTQESTTRMTLDNKSRVLSLPGSEKSSRGFTADMVIIDEAAHVEDALFAAVLPTMATKPHARAIALTTPRQRKGWFFEQWHSGEGWEKISITASQCPRISQDFLKEQMRSLGPLKYAAEFDCQWLDDQMSTFNSDLIRKAFEHDDFEPIQI
jgi:Terminase large subunit, T4likevirus-type, N-terminal